MSLDARHGLDGARRTGTAACPDHGEVLPGDGHPQLEIVAGDHERADASELGVLALERGQGAADDQRSCDRDRRGRNPEQYGTR